MADDTPKTTKDLGKNVGKSAKEVDNLTDSVKANTEALDAWETETDQANKSQRSFLATLRDEVQEIKNAAKEIGSFKSQLNDLSSSTKGYLHHLKTQLSMSNQYNVLLQEMQQGQKNFSKSLLASTNQLGSASAESQKHVDALHDAYADATRMAGEYNIEVGELKANAERLANTFATQLGAMGQHSKALQSLAKDTMLFSRFMGVDLSEATELVNDRLENSTKSLGEVRKEIMTVAKEADNWTRKLQSMGREALATGNVTRQGFLRVIQDIKGEFRGGMFAAEGFAKSTGALLEMAKKQGFTPSEAKTMATGFGKFIRELGSAQSFFGIKTAQVFGGMLNDLTQIQDATLRKRLEPYAKKQLEGQELNILDLQAIAGATQGSSEGIKLLLKSLKTSGMDPQVMRSVIGQAMGPGQQHLADTLTEYIQSGQAEKAFELIGDGNEDAKNREKEQMDFWKKDLEQLMKEGSTATKIQYQTAQEIHKMRMKVEAFMQKYPMMMMAIMAAAQAGGSLLGKAGGALLGRLGLGGGAAMAGGGGAAGAGAGGVGLAGAGAVTAVTGVAVAAVGGIVAGRMLDKWVGQKIAEGDRRMSRRMGQEKELSTWIALKLGDAVQGANKVYVDELLEFKGEVTEADRKSYYQRQKQIEWAKKNWNTLDDTKKAQIEKMEIMNDTLKSRIEAPIDPDMVQANQLMLIEKQKDALVDAYSRIQKETKDADFKNAETTQKWMRDMLNMTGFLMKQGDPTQAIAALEKTDFFQKLQSKAGIGKDAATQLLIKAMAEKRFSTQTTELPKKRAREIFEDYQKVLVGEEGKKFTPEMIQAVKSYVEQYRAAGEAKTNKIQLEIVGSDMGTEKASTRDAGGTVTMYGTSQVAVKATPRAQSQMAGALQSRMPKRS